jgi:hypothetical protein
MVEYKEEKKRKENKSRPTFDIEVLSFDASEKEEKKRKEKEKKEEEENNKEKETSQKDSKKVKTTKKSSNKAHLHSKWFVAQDIDRLSIVPKGGWQVVEGKGVYWVGDDEPLKEGDLVTFTSVSILSRDEFVLAIK